MNEEEKSTMKYMTNSIRQTLAALRDDGINISENALRNWVKRGDIPAVYSGVKAYLWYPNVLSFLSGARTVSDKQP